MARLVPQTLAGVPALLFVGERMTSDQGPLAGMVVLDLTQIMAGPVCTMLLADLGADVLKIERPNGGDDARRMGPPFINGWGAGFLALNRNKRSLALNLQAEEGRGAFLRMLQSADVVVENFRPGVMDRLGLGYESLAKAKPSLIYCTISGFGSTGPYRDRGGFDLVAQGMSGLMSITGFPDSPPAKVGVPITDISAGFLAANGILSAYIHVLKTGQGQLVDTSLLEAGIAFTIWESSGYFATGDIPGPLGSAHRVSAPYQALRTADGYINIGRRNPKHLGAVLPRHIGVPVKLSATPGRVRRRAPALGEQSREILSERDFTDGEVEDLIAQGVVSEG